MNVPSASEDSRSSSGGAPAEPLPPVPGRPPRRAVEATARLILALAVGAVGLLAAVSAFFSPQPPSDRTVREFVSTQLVRQGLAVVSVWVADRKADGPSASFQVNIETTENREPRYGPLFPAPRYEGESPDLPAWLKLDRDEWNRCRKIAAGPFGARLGQLARLDATEMDLLRLTLLREVEAGGAHQQSSTATVTAERRHLRWRLSLGPLAENNPPPNPAREISQPLSAFAGPVCVLERPADKARLIDLAERLPAIRRRLDAVVPSLTSEYKPSLLAVLKPGAFFAGATTWKHNEQTASTRVFLEITEVRDEEDGLHLTAVLRNDGNWGDTRMFSGRTLFGDGSFELSLTPEAGDGDLAGPFLTDYANGFNLPMIKGDVTVSFALEERSLVWRTPEIELRLDPHSAAERTAIIAELTGEREKKMAAVQPNVTYAGTITERATGAAEKWVLRFVAFDPDSSQIHATLEKPDAPSWSLSISGKLDTNRYRAESGSIHFESYDGDIPPKWQQSWDDFWPLTLQLEGNRLQAQKQKYVVRFEAAATPAR
jgi:hypothetical protein